MAKHKMDHVTRCDVVGRLWFVHRCYSQSLLQMGQAAYEKSEEVSLSFVHWAVVVHGEAVTWVSCHLDRPMWRYTTLCVLSKMYDKSLFSNLSIVWNIKILLITFCQERPQILCAKFGANR